MNLGDPNDPYDVGETLPTTLPPSIKQAFREFAGAGLAPGQYAAMLEQWTKMAEFENRLRNQQKGIDHLAQMEQDVRDDPWRARAGEIAGGLGDYNLSDREYQMVRNQTAADYARNLEGTTKQLGAAAAARGLDPMAYSGFQGEASLGAGQALANRLGQMDIDRGRERRANQLSNIGVMQALSGQYTGADSAAKMALANATIGTPIGHSNLYSGLEDSAVNQYALALQRSMDPVDDDSELFGAAGDLLSAGLPFLI